MSDHHRSNNFTPFLLGLVLGAAATYLLTTREGKRILTNLKKRVVNLIDNLEPVLEDPDQVMVDQESKSGPEANIINKDSFDYIKELQAKGRIFGRRFFKRH